MKFILFVEGETEDLAVAAFLKRWLDAELEKPVGLQVVHFRGAGELIKEVSDRALRALNSPKGDVLAVFALLDLYECPLPYPSHQMAADERVKWGKEYMEKQVGHPRFRQFFAVHETEAWLLSDPGIFPAEVGKSLTGKYPPPEEVNSHTPPAKLLKELYKTRLKRTYVKAAEGKVLFRKLNPQTAYDKCPSLKALLDEMLSLAQQAGLSWNLVSHPCDTVHAHLVTQLLPFCLSSVYTVPSRTKSERYRNKGGAAMVTMKWTRDESGRPVPMWKTEAPVETQTRVFGARYHKALRLTTNTHRQARRPLRATAVK